MYEQIDFRFRYQVAATSIHATLLKYLQSKHTEFPREQMILWSLSAFWYPLACRWQWDLKEAELKQKARNAIYQLQQQINYLAQIAGLDPQEFVPKAPATGYGLNDGFTRSPEALDLPVPAIPIHGGKPFSPAGIDTSPNLESSTDAEVPDAVTPGLVRSADDEVLDEAFSI